CLTGGCNLFLTQRCSMGTFCTLLVGRAITNDGFTNDQARLFTVRSCCFDGSHDFLRIMAVYPECLPVIGLKTLLGIIGEPLPYFTVNGNTVIVIKYYQLTQFQGAGKRADLM